MRDINLKKLSELISQKLNQKVEIDKIEKVGSGYHSDGFKLTTKKGKNFFLKRVKSHDLGFEFPERKISSLLVSNSMFKRAKSKPQPIGIVLVNNNEAKIMPGINEETEIYHIQEFGGEGIDYWSLLKDKKEKKDINKRDIEELDKVTDFISSIHKIKHPSKDAERLKAIYNDSLRNSLIHPELTLMLLHDFPINHPFLPLERQKEYIGLMFNLMHRWKDRYDRLRALHGDFWGTNFFFREDGSTWVIDYSRIPWGDPGIDIGWWVMQYLWFYHETRNKYFKELGERFLNMYIEKTKDDKIREAISLIIGFHGLVYTTPKFYPDLDLDLGKRFIDNAIEILKNNQFLWKI